MEFTGRLCVYFCRQAAPIAGGQKPGTSGLRAKTATFMSKGYLANFLQATLDSLEGVRDGVLVLGGDGRFFAPEAQVGCGVAVCCVGVVG